MGDGQDKTLFYLELENIIPFASLRLLAQCSGGSDGELSGIPEDDAFSAAGN